MAIPEEPIPMITKVHIKHFRSIEDAEFTLEPLTVLVGPNGSGKSNLIAVFAFLSDIARYGLASALMKHGGIDSVGWKAPSGKIFGPEFEFHFTNLPMGLTYSFALSRKAKGGYAVERETAELICTEADDVNEGVLRKVAFKGTALKYPDRETLYNMASENADLAQISPAHRKGLIPLALRSIEGQGERGLRLLPQGSLALVDLEYLLGTHSVHLLMSSLLSARAFAKTIGLYKVFPDSLRTPQQTAESSPLRPEAENLASTLQDMLQRKESFVSELLACLAAAVPGVQDLRVSSAGSHQVVEVKHNRNDLKYHLMNDQKNQSTWFDLVHEADGTIRLLAMLTALYQDPSPKLICMEEPEKSMYPNALGVIAEVLDEATLRGQVLVSTHSPDLIGQVHVESLRAVSAESGSTKVGPIAEYQLKSVRENIFSAGELHQIEGLHPSIATGQAEC